MNGRRVLVLSGAVGIALAALIYFLAMRVGSALRGLIPSHKVEVIVFVILLVVSLVEMPIMVFGLRILYRENERFVYVVNAVYVAFASVYAAILILFFGASNFSVLLVSLSLLRWLSGWWIR